MAFESVLYLHYTVGNILLAISKLTNLGGTQDKGTKWKVRN